MHPILKITFLHQVRDGVWRKIAKDICELQKRKCISVACLSVLNLYFSEWPWWGTRHCESVSITSSQIREACCQTSHCCGSIGVVESPWTRLFRSPTRYLFNIIILFLFFVCFVILKILTFLTFFHRGGSHVFSYPSIPRHLLSVFSLAQDTSSQRGDRQCLQKH